MLPPLAMFARRCLTPLASNTRAIGALRASYGNNSISSIVMCLSISGVTAALAGGKHDGVSSGGMVAAKAISSINQA